MKKQCAWCKKVFFPALSSWIKVEAIILRHSGMCPECNEKLRKEANLLRKEAVNV